MNQDPMLAFVKTKLEQDEGVSDTVLARLMTAAKEQTTARHTSFRLSRPARGAFLLAASLAVATCGWFFYANAVNARRESNLADGMELLRVADGKGATESSSIAENLLAWQDAPMDDDTSDCSDGI